MIELNRVRMPAKLGRGTVHCPVPGAAAPMVSKADLVKLAERMAWDRSGGVVTFCATHSKRLKTRVLQLSKLLRSPLDAKRRAAAIRERRGAALLLTVLTSMRRIGEAVMKRMRDTKEVEKFMAENAALLRDGQQDADTVESQEFEPDDVEGFGAISYALAG